MSAHRIFICFLFSSVIIVTADDSMKCDCSNNLLECSNRMKSVISDSDLSYCSSASVFNIPGNYLRNLPEIMLRAQSIIASYNELGLGTKQYFQVTGTLYLSNNYIKNADLFTSYCRISDLDLSNNDIDELSNYLVRCTYLTYFRIANNKLTQLPSNIFSTNRNLRTLDLSENPIRSIFNETFAVLRNLDTLLLRETQISEIPDGTFSDTRLLQHLDLSGNKLSHLPSGLFASLDSLKTLLLRRNRINQLPAGIFDGLIRLTVLNLDSNELTELPAHLFKRLHSLRHLSARDNLLTTLPSLLQCSGPLRSVVLRDNAITDLEEGAVRALWRLDFDAADLRNNPAEVPDWARSAADVSVRFDGNAYQSFRLVVENHGIVTVGRHDETSSPYSVSN